MNDADSGAGRGAGRDAGRDADRDDARSEAEVLRMAMEVMDIIEHAGRIRRRDLIAQLELAGRETGRIEEALKILAEGDQTADLGDEEGRPMIRDYGEWLEWLEWSG